MAKSDFTAVLHFHKYCIWYLMLIFIVTFGLNMNHKKDPECFPRLNPGSFFQEEKKILSFVYQVHVRFILRTLRWTFPLFDLVYFRFILRSWRGFFLCRPSIFKVHFKDSEVDFPFVDLVYWRFILRPLFIKYIKVNSKASGDGFFLRCSSIFKVHFEDSEVDFFPRLSSIFQIHFEVPGWIFPYLISYISDLFWGP